MLRTPPLPPGADLDTRLAWLVADTAIKAQRRQQKFSRWKAIGFWLTGAASVLTAVAGVSILSEWLTRDQAGALAVSAAVVTALVAAYDPTGRSARTALERAEWLRLHGRVVDLDAARALTRHRQLAPSEQERDRLTELWEQHCNLSRADAEALVPSA